MKPSELEEIYEGACRAKRIKPQRDEGVMWLKALKDYDAADVRAALDAWWRSTAVDDKGELKSKWLPAPGELIPMVISANRARRMDAAEPKDFVAYRCPDCGYRCSGWTNDIAPKRCGRCGQPMGVVLREPAQKGEAA